MRLFNFLKRTKPAPPSTSSTNFPNHPNPILRSNKLTFVSITLILVQSVLLSTAYCQDSAKPFPADVDTFSLEITAKGLNKLTMVPTGVRTDDDTRFIFSGHQKGGNVSTFLFGIPGLIVSSEVNANRGQKRLNKFALDEANLVEEMAIDSIRSAFESTPDNPLASQAESLSPSHVLKVSPYATIIQSKKNGTKLHAMLIVALYDTKNADKPIWKTQFYGETEGTLNEATLQDSDLLYENLEQAFERAAWGLARIVSNDFDTYEPIMAKGWLAWFKMPGELPCILLQSSDDKTLLRLPFGAMVAGSGYNVVATKTLTTKPLKKLKDKFKSDFER